jgi:hypothetical protein
MSEAYMHIGDVWYRAPSSVYGQSEFEATSKDGSCGIVHVPSWHRVLVERRSGERHAIAPTAVIEQVAVNGEAVEITPLDAAEYSDGILVNLLDTAVVLATD